MVRTDHELATILIFVLCVMMGYIYLIRQNTPVFMILFVGQPILCQNLMINPKKKLYYFFRGLQNSYTERTYHELAMITGSVCKLTIYPCNKLLYCFRGFTNVIQNGHCSMCWYPSRRVSQLLHFNIALQYIYFIRQNIPIYMLFLEGTTYIMPKTSNKSLQQVILLFQGVAHSSCTGNDHCICMQVVFFGSITIYMS